MQKLKINSQFFWRNICQKYTLIISVLMLIGGWRSYLMPDDKGLNNLIGLYVFLIPGFLLFLTSWLMSKNKAISYVIALIISILYVLVFAFFLWVSIELMSWGGELIIPIILLVLSFIGSVLTIYSIIENKKE